MTRNAPGSSTVHIGTAGWNVPRAHAAATSTSGSHLERYAGVLNCVEINSTFYRLPRVATLQRWADTTPPTFRFAVKTPKTITHTKKLISCGAELAAFFALLAPLEARLGTILVQLPPRLAFDEGTAHEFFTTLRELHGGAVVLEPRHASWFTSGVDQFLRGFEVSRAAVDPPLASELAKRPGGWHGLRYFRLHGTPRTYWSEYPDDFLQGLAATVRGDSRPTWVIFDNTAQGHAFGNALTLASLVCES